MRKLPLLIGVVVCFWVTGAMAESDFYCEVVSVGGSVFILTADEERQSLQEGDHLNEGDWLEIQEESFVDIAYDPQWDNVTHIDQVSKIQIRSLDINKTNVFLEYGDIFAKLDALPHNSSFEIETPVAVAAVRGSAYRTQHRNNITNVYNRGYSPVSVFGKTPQGNRNPNALKIMNNQVTQILKLGQLPTPPRPFLKQLATPSDTTDGFAVDLVNRNQDRLSEKKLTDAEKREQLKQMKTKMFGPHKGPHDDQHQLNHFDFHDFPHDGQHNFPHNDLAGKFHIGPHDAPHQQPHVNQHNEPHVGPHDAPHTGPHD